MKSDFLLLPDLLRTDLKLVKLKLSDKLDACSRSLYTNECKPGVFLLLKRK